MDLHYHHVSRLSGDLERALGFWTSLGATLEKRVRDDAQGLDRCVLLLPGGAARLQLIGRDGGGASAAGPDWAEHLAFHTADFDAVLSAMLAAGATPEREPYRLRPDGGRIAFVLDPDGQRLELVEKA
jgi:catechol 2,3-dioxygenase-like lactoylglutathione lyase family enzyme